MEIGTAAKGAAEKPGSLSVSIVKVGRMHLAESENSPIPPVPESGKYLNVTSAKPRSNAHPVARCSKNPNVENGTQLTHK
jgi:hypothetical protein